MAKPLRGKRGLVVGVMNRRSVAFWIARQLFSLGAKLAIACHVAHEEKVKELMQSEGIKADIFTFDASVDGDCNRLISEVIKRYKKLDFLVHSIAFAPPSAIEATDVTALSYADFALAMKVTAYSFVALVQEAYKCMPAGSTILTMTFPMGSERMMNGYEIVLGPAKRALEGFVMSYADYLGQFGISVVGLGLGPLPTVSARAVPAFEEFRKSAALMSPMGELTTHDVAIVAASMIVETAPMHTGSIIPVDRGLVHKGVVPVKVS